MAARYVHVTYPVVYVANVVLRKRPQGENHGCRPGLQRREWKIHDPANGSMNSGILGFMRISSH